MSLSQFSKAASPMHERLCGKTTDQSAEQSANVDCLISVIPFGMVMLSRPHLLNAYSPRACNPFGRVMSWRLVQ